VGRCHVEHICTPIIEDPRNKAVSFPMVTKRSYHTLEKEVFNTSHLPRFHYTTPLDFVCKPTTRERMFETYMREVDIRGFVWDKSLKRAVKDTPTGPKRRRTLNPFYSFINDDCNSSATDLESESDSEALVSDAESNSEMGDDDILDVDKAEEDIYLSSEESSTDESDIGSLADFIEEE
jgi:hypothetical protein